MEYNISYACISHIGRRRRMNQDNFLCAGVCAAAGQTQPLHFPLTGNVSSARPVLFGVFDGMGGEERGEMAAYLAAKAAAAIPCGGSPQQALENVCRTANLDICRYVEEHDLATCGTTAAMLLPGRNGVNLCNIGDSKIFRCSDGRLKQFSEDHLSIAPYGEKAPLSQYLGIPPEELVLCPYYTALPYTPAEKYLLCSDGLTDMVPLEDITRILTNFSVEQAAQLLLQRALDNGGKDNVTLIVLQTEKQALSSPFERLKKLFG